MSLRLSYGHAESINDLVYPQIPSTTLFCGCWFIRLRRGGEWDRKRPGAIVPTRRRSCEGPSFRLGCRKIPLLIARPRQMRDHLAAGGLKYRHKQHPSFPTLSSVSRLFKLFPLSAHHPPFARSLSFSITSWRGCWMSLAAKPKGTIRYAHAHDKQPNHLKCTHCRRRQGGCYL